MRRRWFTREWNDLNGCPGPATVWERTLAVVCIWKMLALRYRDGWEWSTAWLIYHHWYWFDWTTPGEGVAGPMPKRGGRQ